MAGKVFARLQERQEAIDRQSFFVGSRGYDELSAFEIIRHDLFHLMKAVTKVAQFCDETEHGLTPPARSLTDEVVPDLVVYALQFANALEVDLDDKYERRLKTILAKYPTCRAGAGRATRPELA